MTSAEAYVDPAPRESPSTPPPTPALRWVEDRVADRVVDIEPLDGGVSSAVHRLRLASAQPVVLRRFTVTEWMQREPEIPHDEARNLALLATIDVGVATPTLVAADPDGSYCDVPAILMTEVQGRPNIDPTDPVRWAEQLAACLARIHEQPIVAELPAYRRWDRPDRPAPLWADDPDQWLHARDLAAGDLPAHPPCFLHRDYHPNNVHWLDGEICAVVDWLGMCTGPLAGDLSHCRWNLAILGSPSLADHFTEHYRLLTGYSEDVQAFDLATVLSGPVGPFPTFAWNALGRTDLTSESVAPRINLWLRHVMAGDR